MNPVSRAACAAVLLSCALGCADKPADPLRVGGNVVSVSGAPAASVPRAPHERLFEFAGRLSDLWAAPAIAQSSCGAAVEGVLACLATEGPPDTFMARCARVRSNCEFEVTIDLAAPGDTLNLFFCADADGDGQCAPSEPSAPYLNFDKVGNFCNGDVLRVNDVAIDFASQTCTGSPTSVVADGCAPPDPTAAPTQPPTPGPGDDETPGPGETPVTPPTAGPSATPNLIATATPPPPTPTRTATSKPPPPTPTPTPNCLDQACEQDFECCSGTTCDDGFCVLCADFGETGCSDNVLPCCNDADVCNGDRCDTCVDTGNELCLSSDDCCSQSAICDDSILRCCLPFGQAGCTSDGQCCPGSSCGDGGTCCRGAFQGPCDGAEDCCTGEGLLLGCNLDTSLCEPTV